MDIQYPSGGMDRSTHFRKIATFVLTIKGRKLFPSLVENHLIVNLEFPCVYTFPLHLVICMQWAGRKTYP